MLNFCRIQVLLLCACLILAAPGHAADNLNASKPELSKQDSGKDKHLTGGLEQPAAENKNENTKAAGQPSYESSYQSALQALREGKLEQGEKLLKDTLKMEEQDGASDEKRAQSKLMLADLYRSKRRYSEAEALYNILLARLERKPDSSEVPALKSKIAALYKSQGKFEESLALYKNVLATVEKQSGPDSPQAAIVHANLGLLYQRMGKAKEAETEGQTAIKLFQEKLGDNSNEAAQAKFDLGTLYMQMHNSKKAIPLLESALETFNKSQTAELACATCADQLGTAYFAEGRYTEAEELARKALALYQKLLGPKNMEVAVTLSNLGYRLAKQGKNKDAIESFTKSISIQESAGGPFSPELLANLHGLAEVYVSQTDFDKTESVLRRDLAVREKSFGEKNISLVPALRNLANCLILQGKPGNESEALFARAEQLLKTVPDDQKKAVEILLAQDTVKGLDLDTRKGKKKANEVW